MTKKQKGKWEAKVVHGSDRLTKEREILSPSTPSSSSSTAGAITSSAPSVELAALSVEERKSEKVQQDQKGRDRPPRGWKKRDLVRRGLLEMSAQQAATMDAAREQLREVKEQKQELEHATIATAIEAKREAEKRQKLLDERLKAAKQVYPRDVKIEPRNVSATKRHQNAPPSAWFLFLCWIAHAMLTWMLPVFEAAVREDEDLSDLFIIADGLFNQYPSTIFHDMQEFLRMLDSYREVYDLKESYEVIREIQAPPEGSDFRPLRANGSDMHYTNPRIWVMKHSVETANTRCSSERTSFLTGVFDWMRDNGATFKVTTDTVEHISLVYAAEVVDTFGHGQMSNSIHKAAKVWAGLITGINTGPSQAISYEYNVKDVSVDYGIFLIYKQIQDRSNIDRPEHLSTNAISYYSRNVDFRSLTTYQEGRTIAEDTSEVTLTRNVSLFSSSLSQ